MLLQRRSSKLQLLLLLPLARKAKCKTIPDRVAPQSPSRPRSAHATPASPCEANPSTFRPFSRPLSALPSRSQQETCLARFEERTTQRAFSLGAPRPSGQRGPSSPLGQLERARRPRHPCPLSRAGADAATVHWRTGSLGRTPLEGKSLPDSASLNPALLIEFCKPWPRNFGSRWFCLLDCGRVNTSAALNGGLTLRASQPATPSDSSSLSSFRPMAAIFFWKGRQGCPL